MSKPRRAAERYPLALARFARRFETGTNFVAVRPMCAFSRQHASLTHEASVNTSAAHDWKTRVDDCKANPTLVHKEFEPSIYEGTPACGSGELQRLIEEQRASNATLGTGQDCVVRARPPRTKDPTEHEKEAHTGARRRGGESRRTKPGKAQKLMSRPTSPTDKEQWSWKS